CCQCSSRRILLALINTIDDIHRIQHMHKVGPFIPVNDRVGNSLNLCIISDSGEQILVLRCKDALKGFPLWLYLSLTAGEKLNRKYHPDPPKPAAPNEKDLLSTPTRCHLPLARDVEDRVCLFNPNHCVALDNSGKLEIINMVKLFQEGRHHEFNKHEFNLVIGHISNNTWINKTASDSIAIPAYSVGLPQGEPRPVFEVDFQLK
ncbi:hypothetical protein BT96DRAFT_928480, partial [Gymnopus androsaceus JB14]